MLSSPYLPHVLYALALTSISMNLVSQRREAESEKARVNAQLSILESIKEQLRSDKPLSADELHRLKKLARPSSKDIAARAGVVDDDIKWSDIFRGRKPSTLKEDEEVSKWDKQDLDKMRKEMAK